ncbi:mediator complex, subunit Med16 [Bisporella sp. PMI_857]|nr:mediator complex, subunit Med16 [Bisporella sp. PMI_857]
MPLMDDDMNMGDIHVDDLFGDDTGLSLIDGQPLPTSRPPAQELHQRIDELRASGCCQSIAWSKWGGIASIGLDGTSLYVQNLRCNPKDGTWALSEPVLTPPVAEDHPDIQLKHLIWSSHGSELAIIDAVGRITILTIFASINKPSLSRSCRIDPIDDLQRVVGCYWLNPSPVPPSPGRPAVFHGPAERDKDGGNYRYETVQAPVLGPFHPNPTKSALVCVTANGSLKILWPQTNSPKWGESHDELESIASSDDLITHAAICSDKFGALLIAFATTSKQLRTVRAMIDWGLPKTNEKGPPAALPLNPSIKTRHLTVVSWLYDLPRENIPDLEQSMVQLSHLEFLASCADSSGRPPLSPTIVAVRSYLPSPTSFNQEVRTTVDKWELRERQQGIHPAFEQLSSRRNSVGSQPGHMPYLKKTESFSTNKVAVSLQVMNLGRVLFFVYSDGSVEYRDRATLAETFLDHDNLDKVWHLSQIGFTYSEDEPCLQAILSPTHSSVAQIGNDGKVKWRQLDYRLGDIGSSLEERNVYPAFVAALALSCSTAVMLGNNFDDLLATVNKYVTPTFTYDWLVQLRFILKPGVDYSEEAHYDLLIRNTTIQLFLGIQQSLGFRGEGWARTFAGKYSWIVLQLRHIVVYVTMAANVKPKGPGGESLTPLDDPEIIVSLAGSVHWVLDLMAWIIDALFEIKKDIPSSVNVTDASSISLPDLLKYLKAKNNISLHLLLSSPNRGFLTAICRRIQHLDYIARKAIIHTSGFAPNQNTQNGNSSAPPALINAYIGIATLLNNTLIKIKTFETLLLSLGTSIKSAYGAHNMSGSSSNAKEARNNIEFQMILGGGK